MNNGQVWNVNRQNYTGLSEIPSFLLPAIDHLNFTELISRQMSYPFSLWNPILPDLILSYT